MRVLVTAFFPFNNLKNNYSMEVINYIDGVSKEILDVVYDKCFDYLKNKYDLNSYDLIIALGEARMREELTLETQAVNISSCSLKDNSGVLKVNEKINENSLDFIQTKVDISKVDDIVIKSNDAGKFVCNNLYFHLLTNYPEKSLFIHVPNCYDNEENYKKHAETIMTIIKKLLYYNV